MTLARLMRRYHAWCAQICRPRHADVPLELANG